MQFKLHEKLHPTVAAVPVENKHFPVHTKSTGHVITHSPNMSLDEVNKVCDPTLACPTAPGCGGCSRGIPGMAGTHRERSCRTSSQVVFAPAPAHGLSFVSHYCRGREATLGSTWRDSIRFGKSATFQDSQVSGASFLSWFAEEGLRVYGETIPASLPHQRILVLKQPVGVVSSCG